MKRRTQSQQVPKKSKVKEFEDTKELSKHGQSQVSMKDEFESAADFLQIDDKHEVKIDIKFKKVSIEVSI